MYSSSSCPRLSFRFRSWGTFFRDLRNLQNLRSLRNLRNLRNLQNVRNLRNLRNLLSESPEPSELEERSEPSFGTSGKPFETLSEPSKHLRNPLNVPKIRCNKFLAAAPRRQLLRLKGPEYNRPYRTAEAPTMELPEETAAGHAKRVCCHQGNGPIPQYREKYKKTRGGRLFQNLDSLGKRNIKKARKQEKKRKKESARRRQFN